MVTAAPGRPVATPVGSPDTTLRTRGTARALPSGRAVTGGLLVAASVLGVLAMARASGGPAAATYVVVTAPVAPGTTIGATHVAALALPLPPAVAAHAFHDPADVVGRVALAPLAVGDLVQASSLAAVADVSPSHEISFAVDADRAVDGRVGAGDRVDVLATYGSGESAVTEVVAHHVSVVDVTTGGDSIAQTGLAVLTVALDDPSGAIRVAHAARAGEITVVRTTYGGSLSDGPVVYRPSPQAATADVADEG
jgi:Flp pilus assembly protein CpaB